MDGKTRIRDLPLYERPYMRFMENEGQKLSNAEILAIIIKSGCRGKSAIQLATEVLCMDENNEGLSFLINIPVKKLASIKGMGNIKAIRLKACVELSRRMMIKRTNRKNINSPEAAVNIAGADVFFEKNEVLLIIMLDVKNNLIMVKKISEGMPSCVEITVSNIIKAALKASAVSFILLHNHPEGSEIPSKEDIKATKVIKELAGIVGIGLKDHIIIGKHGYYSMKENKVL